MLAIAESDVPGQPPEIRRCEFDAELHCRNLIVCICLMVGVSFVVVVGVSKYSKTNIDAKKGLC